MSRTTSRPSPEGKASILEGAPDWITEELLADTQRTWQPFYDRPLTEAEALEILLDVGHLVDVLGESDG